LYDNSQNAAKAAWTPVKSERPVVARLAEIETGFAQFVERVLQENRGLRGRIEQLESALQGRDLTPDPLVAVPSPSEIDTYLRPFDNQPTAAPSPYPAARCKGVSGRDE